MENIWQRILQLFQQVEHFYWFYYLNQLGKYNSVISITLKTHWKENSSYIPLPFGNLPKIVMALFNEGSTKIV